MAPTDDDPFDMVTAAQLAALCDDCKVRLAMTQALGGDEMTLCDECVHRLWPDHVCDDEP